MEKKEQRRFPVSEGDLIDFYCELNNIFVNVKGGLFNDRDGVIRMRVSNMKGRIAKILNECNGLNNVFGPEFHAIEIKSDQIKKIIAKLK